MAEPTDGQIAVTNNEVGERRHLVQPYKERPVVELSQGTVACPFCGNGNFRRSRLRFSDLLEMLLLRYPVRCTRCSQRQYVEIAIALLSFPPKHVGPRPATGQDTWKNWTSADAPVQIGRPMSTALGPKARKLEFAPDPANTAPQEPTPPKRGDDDYIVW